jgi:hypothetical protein
MLEATTEERKGVVMYWMKSVAAIAAMTVMGGVAAGTAAVAQPAPAQPKTFSVTATVNQTEPIVGHHVKIKGTVTPATPGATVKLQLRYTGQDKWKNVDTTTLTQAGKFKFIDKVTTVRERTYRVVKPAGPNRAAAHSLGAKVTVYGWRDLTTLKPATLQGMGEVKKTVINDVTYPASVVAYEEGYQPSDGKYYIEYNLGRHCKAFRATVGLADSSPTGGSAQVKLMTDGTQRYDGTFGLTQSALVTFDVTGVFRISITAVPTANGIAAVGTPQVLCNY